MPAGNPARIALPKSWNKQVRWGLLQVIALAQYAILYTRGPAATSRSKRVRLRAHINRLEQELALVCEELRIKDARLNRIPAHRRPHYPPSERMAILELRAARGWSSLQVADAFLLTRATISGWMRRLDEQSSHSLVQLREPVNKFPDFVRYAVQKLKTLCPGMGKVKIAQTLCRAGLHLAATTVGRIVREPPSPMPKEAVAEHGRAVTAKRANHVWHIDLTTVPIGAGFWAPWLPFALAQSSPFGCWVTVVVDHFSRPAMGISVSGRKPDAVAVRSFLGRTIQTAGSAPKYLVSDKGGQFWQCADYKKWCQRQGIRLRFGAVGKQGSIAVVERFIRTLKDEATRKRIVPLRRHALHRDLRYFVDWYNQSRPHSGLEGKTPDEMYFALRPAKRRPRIEPRKAWPRRSSCATPRTLVAGQPGDRFTLRIDYYRGRRHLPIVSLQRAA